MRGRREKNILSSVEIIFIIMERILCAPIERNASWLFQQHHGEGIEEMKNQLFCASLELERMRANAEARKQLQEAKLLELQELLTATRRERDEAREQLLKLNHRLAEYSTLRNTQQRVLSSNRPQWPDTRLVSAEPDEQNPSSSTAAAAAMHSISSPLVELTDQFRWNSAVHHFDFPNHDLHRPPTPSPKIHCSNLFELQDQPFYHHNEQRQSLVQRQESEQRPQVETHPPHFIQHKSTDCDLWQQQQGPSNLFLGVAEPSVGGHMTCHEPKPGLVNASLPILGSTPAVMPAHLPEPPESDLQVMLSSLPERGKLVQAVMQAGPLLQTLLMAGPLPEWKYPPPRLDTVDTLQLPKISMCLSPNCLPIAPIAHSPTAALDPLLVNPPVPFSHRSLSLPTRINESPTAASSITPLQSSSSVASSSSKLLCPPLFNSQDSTITTAAPLKFDMTH